MLPSENLLFPFFFLYKYILCLRSRFDDKRRFFDEITFIKVFEDIFSFFAIPPILSAYAYALTLPFRAHPLFLPVSPTHTYTDTFTSRTYDYSMLQCFVVIRFLFSLSINFILFTLTLQLLLHHYSGFPFKRFPRTKRHYRSCMDHRHRLFCCYSFTISFRLNNITLH